MSKNLHSFYTLLLIGIPVIIILGMFNVQGQKYIDDPNLDQVPKWLIDSIQKGGQKASEVITINDYDNYYLGVDLAEGHISTNPQAPAQFFTAFNVNNSHGTLDGYEWYQSQPAWGASVWGDPVTAYDSLGNLYYEIMYGSSGIQGCKVVRSTDNGQTWSSAVTAINGFDKNWIAADQTSGPYANYVYTVMTGGGGGNISRSTNYGASWNNTYTFSTQSLPGMMVCVGAYNDIQGGAVYVVTNGGNAFNSTYTFYRSLNGGSSFQYMSSQNFAGYVGSNVNGRHSVQNMRTRPYPFITADNSYGPYRGRLYLIYASNDPPGNGNKPDIWCRYSDNGGTTWSSNIRVNDDINPQSNHQFAPATWCDKNTGRLYVQWMDSRDTPASDSAMIYGTYSDDGGVTFEVNQKISNQKMKINCTTCGGSGSPRYQGDYNGIVSNSKVSMATWADFRWGTFASFTGYLPDFAMRVYPVEKEISYQDTVWAVVPDVKLYSDTAMFFAEAEEPTSGSFTITFPEGNIITVFPDSIPVVITANNVPLGEYTLFVTGQSPNGTPVHQREATLILNELPLPEVQFVASDSLICAGSSTDFTDQTLFFPTQWFWTFEGGNPSTSNDQNPTGIVYNSPGSYDVTLIAVNSSGYIELTKSDYITASVAPDPPEGEDIYACIPGIISPLEATGDSVTWYSDPELTNVVNTGNIFETGQTEPGTYTYYVTQSFNGCESSPLEISLNINLKPEASLDPFVDVCETEPSFALSGGSPDGGVYEGPGVENGMFSPSFVGAGIYSIGYIYTDENQCSDTAFQDMVVIAAPYFELGTDTAICADLTYTLDASTPDAVSYLWSPGNQTTPTIDVDSSGIGIGSQEFSVVVTGANGCARTESITITFEECSGIKDIPGLQALKIYPNPNKGSFTVIVSSTQTLHVDIRILNSVGIIQFEEKDIKMEGLYRRDISLPQLKPGIYYLSLRNTDGVAMKKIVIY